MSAAITETMSSASASIAAASTSSSSSSFQVRVVQYNLLAPELARSAYFVHCSPHAIRREVRLKEIKSKLEPELKQKSIICLQEVSHTWANALVPFFTAHGYTLVTAFGASDFSGHMGPALALDTKCFSIEELKIARCMDLKPWPSSKSKPGNVLVESLTSVVQWFLSLVGLYKQAQNPWDRIKNRYNKIIMTKLRHVKSDTNFSLSTYHMPCEFRSPSNMLIYASIAAQSVQSFSGNLPCIFAGDFNFKPGSPPYKLLTEGFWDGNCEEPDANGHYHRDPAAALLDSPQEGSTWHAMPLSWAFRSAYVSKDGTEPAFTNYARTVNDSEAFCDTIDYIFHSEDLQVDACLRLPDSTDCFETVLPCIGQPSDHLMLSSTFSLSPSSSRVKSRGKGRKKDNNKKNK